MKFIQPDFIETQDGSRTLRNGNHGSLYHSDRGARGEAMHVYMERGFLHFLQISGKKRITVFEMGFGSGLNCFLTLECASELGVEVEYHAVELYPVDPNIAVQYIDNEEFKCLHNVPWDEPVRVAEGFTLIKHYGDLATLSLDGLRGVDVVYFDAFSPDEQPELWSEEVFTKLYRIMSVSGVVVTYSSKGMVKMAMRGAGFTVERLEGALGKHHMLRAVK